MLRKVVAVGAVVYVGALLAVGALLWSASPGPAAQAITGVGIGAHDRDTGIAYLSGRRLQCAPLPAGSAFTTSCTVDIAGQPLTIQARRNAAADPNQLGGACTARYAGAEWPCAIGSRHVHTHWFAFVPEPLGLSRGDLDAVRARYPVENLPERSFLQGIAGVVIVSPLLALLCAVVWLRPRFRQPLVVAGAALASALLVFVGTGALALTLTAGFWD